MFNENKTFKNEKELEKIFGKINLSKMDKIICSCG
jgi:3-mercaptopyruvate sulfurtransferase SseA